MSKRVKERPIIENVTIEDVAAEGKSIARIDDLVVFVPFAVPGDVVDLRILKRKHKYAEAVVERFHKYADNRQVPRCSHFGICGGCKWQNLPYKEQLRYKQKQVEDAMTRIAKVEFPDLMPIVGSEQIWCYRNKLEYSFSNMRWLTAQELQEIDNSNGTIERKQPGLGFHIPGAFDKVLHIEECHLQDTFTNSLRNETYRYALERGISFINLRSREGLLRDMMVRILTTGHIMVLYQANVQSSDDMQLFLSLLEHIAECFPQITSLLYVINTKCNDTFADLDVHCYKGEECIYETMENLRFKIGPKSFFQTNSKQAYTLYSIVRDMAAPCGDEVLYDLYTGTGTIAQFLASSVKRVVGIEYVPEAIEDAKINAELNGITNAQFYAGDMKDILNSSFIEEHGVPDIVVTDPPRTGMHGDVIDVILAAKPNRIVYVSCNPATQARDIQLMDSEYRVKKIQPVDMFPHTHHVEVVTLLERR